MSWVSLLFISLVVYWILVTVFLIADDRDPTKTLAWLVFLAALPLLGLIFYLLFGRNWKKRTARSDWWRKVSALARPTMERVYGAHAAAKVEARELAAKSGQERLVDVIAGADRAQPLPACDVRLLIDGGAKFARLKEELAKAQDSINIQYFIWEHDQLTAELTEILLERLAAGVEVRVLNDFFGNLLYKKEEIERLRAAGAHCASDVSGIQKLNYRDHRKIVVIDGVLGFTGGINVGQEYIDGKPRFASWRDTHVCFYGPLVAELQKLFAVRWHEVTEEDLFQERFFPRDYPETGRRTLAQVVSSSVENPWEPAHRAHVVAMSRAKERIWIQSPYFVPSSDVYQTMINAALSGLDIRFMMTGVPDKRLVYWAAESYFRPFLQAGGKVYRYKAGFFHAKTMTIDGALCAIGTMNLDVRSLELHKELMVWFYDQVIAEEHEDVFRRDLERCEEITLETVASWSRPRRFRNSAIRLASNLI